MKRLPTLRRIPLALFLTVISVLAWILCTPVLAQQAPAEEIYFAVEMNGKVIGYAQNTLIFEEGAILTRIDGKVVLKLSALGQDFDVEVFMREERDPETGKTIMIDTDVTRGSQKMGGTLLFKGNEVHYTPKAAGQPKILELEPDVLVDDQLFYPFLVHDMGPGKADKKTYKFLEVVLCEVSEQEFTWKGVEKIRLLGREFDCLVFEFINRTNGLSGKHWIEKSTARAVRSENSNGMNSYLADAGVKSRIERGNLDDTIFGDVDVAIADFQAITYMKVQAKIRTAGEWVTTESLNIPGQQFTGEVKDNLIDGIFEIEHKRYDGKNAPTFPADFSGDGELKKCLEPENMVESDDPVLVKKAQEITEGSKDAWEAACRLTRWVADEIKYEIPGGSARYTFDTRKGECGSHARLLTAFCRAAGIPARIAAGGMYTPNHGGSFGQHGWNEVYMGDAGWITVDSTVHEVDYVDSGHIRIGNNVSFNPVEMKVLDYRAGSMAMGKEHEGLNALKDIPWEVGRTYTYIYTLNNAEIGRETLTVKSHDQSISGSVYTCSTGLDLTNAMTSSSEWKLDQSGSPLHFATKGKARGVEFTVECMFSEGKVVEKIVQGGNPVERTIELPGKVYLLFNNHVGLLAFLAAAAPAKEGEARTFKIFHPNSMQVLPAQVTAKGLEKIDWGGKELECRLLQFSFAGAPIMMWVDETGRLIRESEAGGTLVMELAARTE